MIINMPSDYDKIRKDNIEEYGKGKRHLSFLGRLYSDRTQFIFELLQNAEDAGASKVLFDLREDKLLVKHNAPRLFNEKDVRGVCGVGEGTKEGDLNQIGTFGIGFKSVYAFTDSPEIHSGDEHFRIESYVRPFKAESIEPEIPWTTLFILRFNSEKVTPVVAYKEISNRLKNLSARTLLFLKKIAEVEYKLFDGTSGVYLREEENFGKARIVSVIGDNNSREEDERWLVFQKPVNNPEDKKIVYIEIAFKLQFIEDSDSFEIIPVKLSPLVVYFPTQKETNLGFLVQGPYKTTPARDNIPKDDSWNSELIKKSALFMLDVLNELKKMGLLNTSLLNAMPIYPEKFHEESMFYSFFTIIRDGLFERELLPAADGSYVSGKNAVLARGADLKKLFNKFLIRTLYNNNDLNWLDGSITQDLAYDLRKYLIETLSVDEILPISIARKITADLLKNQSDEWMITFYKYYYDRKESWQESHYNWQQTGPLRNKPIIRLNDNSHTVPFREDGKPNAFLTDGLVTESSLPTVKIELTRDEKANQFLNELGLPKLDLVEEVIEKILPKYLKDKCEINFKEHIKDIKAIINAFETDSREKKKRLISELVTIPFILSDQNNQNHLTFFKAEQLYIASNDLKLFFTNNEILRPLHPYYSNAAIQIFCNIGLIDELPINCRSDQGSDKQISLDYDGYHRRGLNGFDADIEVIGLDRALNVPSINLSQLIWNKIARRYSHCIKGKIIRSSRQDFSPQASYYKELTIVSNFGKLLIENHWLPDKNGNFFKPADLLMEDLPDTFIPDELLADRLGMKNDAVSKLAKEIQIEIEDIKFLQNHKEEFKNWRKSQLELRQKPSFPQKSSSNPERRQQKFEDQVSQSQSKKYERRERNVRTTRNDIEPKPILRELYTNDDDIMVCQICINEMPFKKRDNTYYFEAIELFGNSILPLEHESQYLALCPVCAAKYIEFIRSDEMNMELLLKYIKETDQLELPLKLGTEQAKIHFVEVHLSDFKQILNYEN